MNRRNYQTDAAKKAGVKLPYDGATFTIASQDRPEWTRALDKARSKVSPARLKADPSLAETIVIEALANAVLLTWEGVKDGPAGAETDWPPTLENRIAMLTEAPDFRAWVAGQASDMANFKAEVAAEDATAIKSQP